MDEKELKSYRDSGKIAADVREWSRELITPDAKVLDIAENIEKKIIESGAEIAFPVNVCINDITAHYTPKFNDETVIKDDDVVTIDIGVHVDGYIADTAYTIDLSGNYSDLLDANKRALDNAISLVKPGASVADIGKVVWETLADAGFKPIENLTGHEVKQYELHAGLSIPNIHVTYEKTIEEGMVLAIEPFATNGYGKVIEARHAEIFSLIKKRPTRMREARILLKDIEKRKNLPFAERWFAGKINPMKLNLVIRDMVSHDILRAYPVLHEKEKGIVSQFEHTMIVTADGCEVTTR